MAEFQAYKLEMHSALHLGERGVGMEKSGEVFRSDSLFGAVCAVIRETEGAAVLRDWLEAFLGPEPPFLFSSTFPYCGNLLLFPRPLLRILGSTFAPGVETDYSEKSGVARRTKDVAYVSQGILENMLARNSMDAFLAEDCFLMGDRVWITQAERTQLPANLEVFWQTGEPVPRVAIDRSSSRSNIYRVGRVHFQKDCGLHFLVQWRNEKWRPLLENTLIHLGHGGIGGERSAGHGQYELKGPISLDLACPSQSARIMTMSLYHPTEQEVRGGVLDNASYDLLMRQGWVDSPETRTMRRKGVRMLKEGSVVSTGAKGDIAAVTPDVFSAHPIYRFGLAFPVCVGEEPNG